MSWDMAMISGQTTDATRAQSMVMIHRALQQENSALPKDADL